MLSLMQVPAAGDAEKLFRQQFGADRGAEFLRRGLTFAEACREFHATRGPRAPRPTLGASPTKLATAAPDPRDAPAGSPELAEQLRRQFGGQRGDEFFRRGLNYWQALDEAANEVRATREAFEQKRQAATAALTARLTKLEDAQLRRRGFAARVERSIARMGRGAKPEPPPEKPTGLAAKIRFAKGAFDVTEYRRNARAEREAQNATP
jgi:hypothetical protein